MTVNIRAGSHCLYCGAIFNLTKHHLKINGTKVNVKIILCRNCHDDVDLNDDPQIIKFIRSKFVLQ